MEIILAMLNLNLYSFCARGRLWQLLLKATKAMYPPIPKDLIVRILGSLVNSTTALVMER